MRESAARLPNASAGRWLLHGVQWLSPAIALLFIAGLNWCLVWAVNDWQRSVPHVGVKTTVANEDDKLVSVALRLDRPMRRDGRLRYRCVPGSAVPQTDYRHQEGIVHLAKGSVEGRIDVPIVDDGVNERREQFRIALYEPQGVRLDKESVAVTICDNDELRLSVHVPPIVRDTSRPLTVPVNLRLASPCDRPVTVRYRARDGTARGGRDYRLERGEICLPAGQTSGQIPLELCGVSNVSIEKQFWVVCDLIEDGSTFSAEAPIAIRYRARGLSVDVGDLVVDLQPGLEQDAMFAVTLSSPPLAPVSVRYQTEDGSAAAGTHYRSHSGMIQFDAGVTQVLVPVRILPPEADGRQREFFLRIASVDGARLGKDKGVAQLNYPPPPPELLVNESEVRVRPNPMEWLTVAIPLRLSRESDWIASVEYTTKDGTAKAGRDYRPTAGRLVFAKGEIERVLEVPVLRPDLGVPERTFLLQLANPKYLTLSDDRLAVTLEEQPTLDGKRLILIVLTESLHKAPQSLLQAVGKLDSASNAELLGDGVWFVDAEQKPTVWRPGTAKAAPANGRAFSDADFKGAFDAALALASKLHQAAKSPDVEVTIIWKSERNPDYGDLDKTLQIPQAPSFSCIWIRNDRPGEVRTSRRLRHWFRGRVRAVSDAVLAQTVSKTVLD